MLGGGNNDRNGGGGVERRPYCTVASCLRTSWLSGRPAQAEEGGQEQVQMECRRRAPVHVSPCGVKEPEGAGLPG